MTTNFSIPSYSDPDTLRVLRFRLNKKTMRNILRDCEILFYPTPSNLIVNGDDTTKANPFTAGLQRGYDIKGF